MVKLGNKKFLHLNSTIREAISLIENSKNFIVPVLSKEHKLIGIISDGDIRRALLKGFKLTDKAKNAMKKDPILAFTSSSEEEIVNIMKENNVAAIPVVDKNHKFFYVQQTSQNNIKTKNINKFWAAIIMAGGEGQRLRPFTIKIPKPMIEVGGLKLIERQIKNISKTGLKKIFISTNYLGHLIEDYFEDGKKLNLNIKYLREKKKLGTAGSLSLLPETPKGPLLITNGDIITTSNYNKMLDYHYELNSSVTIASVNYKVEIPFGVMKCDHTNVLSLEEKPSETFLCNAGIYVVSPEVIKFVPKNKEFNMTDLIMVLLKENKKVSIFPLHEYWKDVGNPNDLEEVRVNFKNEIFK